MKKNFLSIFIASIIVIILLIILCFYACRPAYLNQTIKQETTALSIHINYPTFKNLLINKEIETFIGGALNMAKKFPPPDPRIPYKYKNTLDISYSPPFISDKFISTVFSVLTFTGGAHPNTVVIAKSYDVKTGKALELIDLGLGSAEVISRIKERIVLKLTEGLKRFGYADAQWIKAGVTPENLENFALSGNTITFYFSPYTVACYAAGPQSVKLKLKDLR